MKIKSALSNFYQKAKSVMGEALVSDDFGRRGSVKDKVVLGASAGAAIGGGIGLVRGISDQLSDKVVETNVTHSINDPSLNGYNYRVREDWDRCFSHEENCRTELDGWWHRYSPRINQRQVGTYQEPVLQHSHKSTVLSATLTGALTGAGVGAAIGLATGVVGRAVGGGGPFGKGPLPDEVRKELKEEAGELAVKSTLVGAGIGATIGLSAGLMEKSNSVVVNKTWDEPVLVDKNLGSIPRDHYEWNWGGWRWSRPDDFSNHSPKGNRAIVRKVPVLDVTGSPRMQRVTKTLDSSRFSPTTGLIGGTLLGAGLGLATGVAASLVSQVLADGKG